ncbi:MAG: PA2169 family four-helix-bundle protein [Aquabacterium sp.]|nr:PA2169 family four-helix-bundle protein [Ferruginibacter sp.]
MENTQQTIDTLNDLVLINNDRIAGYEKAMAELKEKNGDQEDMDLVILFENMIDESREMRNALGREVQVMGGSMAEGTMTSGKIYRAWMDFKAVFSGKDRHTILSNCETGEDAAQKAYKAALAEEHLPHYLHDLISTQKDLLLESHDEVKALRDQVAHQ